MFFLALIAILILGVISFGLLKLLSKSISNQRSHSEQESETAVSKANPEQRSMINRIENQMYILYGFALTTGSVALTMYGIPNHNLTVVIIDAIIAVGFLGLGFWRLAILKKYKNWDWKDFWGDKT
jgi:hypothetical protein